MTIVVARTTEALRALEPAWWDLFARVPDALPFASPAWLLPWWECFAPGELLVVAVAEGGALAALAPLWIEEGALGRRILPLGLGITDMLDVLVDPIGPPGVASRLAQAVVAEAGPSEGWWLEEAVSDTSALTFPDPPGWRSATTRQSACPALVLPEGEPLRAALPARQWRKWSMARHRADRRGWSVTAASAPSATEALQHLFRLHGRRWQTRGEPGVLADAPVQAFHERVAPELLRRGLADLLLLRVADTVAGVYYGLCRPGVSLAYLGGFDPDFAFESPGTLLLGAALERAAARGPGLFSFLRGQEPYKYAWGATDRWNSLRILTPAA